MGICLEVDGLSFAYDRQKQILKDIRLEIEENTMHAVFGPNGCGKSTLLKCLNHLLWDYDGEIRLFSKRTKDLSRKEIARSMAYVPQESHSYFSYSSLEMVLMGRNAWMTGTYPSKEDEKKAIEAMLELGLEDLKDFPFAKLSGGQKQMVLIARALAQESQIIILDEPTSALDFSNKLKVWSILNQLKKEGKTLIVCCHDPNDVLFFCDRVTILKDGKVLAHGPTEETLTLDRLKVLYGDICTLKNGYILPKFDEIR